MKAPRTGAEETQTAITDRSPLFVKNKPSLSQLLQPAGLFPPVRDPQPQRGQGADQPQLEERPAARRDSRAQKGGIQRQNTA